MLRRTKIVCTIGPASDSEDVLRRMMAAGMDVARLNFSHGTHEEHAMRIQTLRRLAREMGHPLAVLLDLQGPKIRTGPLEGEAVELVAGRKIVMTTRQVVGTAERIPTTYEALARDVKVGDRILLDDGLMELRVSALQDEDIECDIVVGGTLKEHKGINLPGVAVSAPSLTEKDREDLEFGIEHEVDFVALSFVRRAEDVVDLRRILHERGLDVPVVAKIEKPEAVEHLDGILNLCDGCMVARGDLAVETAPEVVPILQKRIISRARGARVPVITATQMLESMTEHPRPTRAEASDVANAILDGTDAVMLSGETAVGKYPVESVAMMARIAEVAEEAPQHRQCLSPIPMGGPVVGTFANAAAFVATEAAENLNAKAIVAFTTSGSSARLVSQYRPNVPIIAATTTETACRRSALYWGVTPLRIPEVQSTDAMIQAADRAAAQEGMVQDGDTIVIVAGTPVGSRGTTNLMKLHRVGEMLDIESFQRDTEAIRRAREHARGKRVRRINLDRQACISCHLCARICPFFIFEMHEQDAVVVEANVPNCALDFLCVARCPTDAITIEVEGG